MNRPITLYIIDDHTLVTDGIKAMLAGNNSLTVAACFSNGADFFRGIKISQPDVALIDIQLPDMSGIEIARILSETYPQVKTLILSALEDEASVTAAIKSGARGYLTKDCPKDELIKAVESVMVGNIYFGEGLSGRMFKGYLQKLTRQEVPDESKAILTDREKEVVQLFAEGLLYKQIADRLQISIKTVETHKANIMRKLEIKNTAELVKYAIRQNLTSL